MKEASALGKRTLSPGCRVATTRIALLLVVVPSLSPCLLLFSCHSPAQYSAPAGPPARPVCPGPPPGLYDITAPVRIVALASQTQDQKTGELPTEASEQAECTRLVGARGAGPGGLGVGSSGVAVGLWSEIKYSIGSLARLCVLRCSFPLYL